MAVLSVSVLPIALYSVILAHDSYRENQNLAHKLMRHYALLAESYERQLFDRAGGELSLLARQEAVRLRSEPACSRSLQGVVAEFRHYQSILVTDADGRVVCSARSEEIGLDLSGTDWFQDVSRGGERQVTRALTRTPLRKENVVTLAEPLLTDLEGFDGAVALFISIPYLRVVHRTIAPPVEAEVFLVDGDGRLITGQSRTRHLPSNTLPFSRADQGLAADGFMIVDGYSRAGETRLFAQTPLRAGALYMVFSAPTIANAFDWVTGDLVSRLFAPLLMWLLALVAAMAGADKLVVQWLHRLRSASDAYSVGDFSARPQISAAPAELRDLGRALTDMADRLKLREEDLKRSLEEKQVLLQEIHHRVKNNLQIVSSLLSLQSKAVPEGDAKRALSEAHSRIGALALVHRRIYESEKLKTLNLEPFLSEICAQLQSANNISPSRVKVRATAPPLETPAEIAVPVALLISEAVTNAFKYAFPDQRRGEIHVEFRVTGDNAAELTIADNGVGRANAVDKPAKEGSGIGQSLMSAFARQLGGELIEEGPPGLTLRLRLNGEWIGRMESGSFSVESEETPSPVDRESEKGAEPLAEKAFAVLPKATSGSDARAPFLRSSQVRLPKIRSRNNLKSARPQ